MKTISALKPILRGSAIVVPFAAGAMLFLCLSLMSKIEQRCAVMQAGALDDVLGLYNVLYLTGPWVALSLLYSVTTRRTSILLDGTAVTSTLGAALSLSLSWGSLISLSGGSLGYQCPTTFVDGYDIFRRSFFFDDGIAQIGLSGLLLLLSLLAAIIAKTSPD
jgi:hypothetical protein